MPRAAAYFAVAKGRQAGIYRTWPECEAQVKGYSGAVFKKFPSEKEAQGFIAQHAAGASSIVLPNKRSRPDDEDSGQSSRSKAARSSASDEHSDTAQPSLKVVKVYCDGAATGNGRDWSRAGWGVWFADEGQPLHELNESRRLPGKVQTNNRGELMAIIRAIQLAPKDCQLVIMSDSQYSISAITSWQHAWRPKGWKRSNGEDVQNKDLIRRLEREMRARKPRPKLVHVKGHAGTYGNEMADRLATQGATLPDVPESQWEEMEPSDSEPEGEVASEKVSPPPRAQQEEAVVLAEQVEQEESGSSTVRATPEEEESPRDVNGQSSNQEAPVFLPATMLMPHRLLNNTKATAPQAGPPNTLQSLTQMSSLFKRRSPAVELKPLPRAPPLQSLIAVKEEESEKSRSSSPPPAVPVVPCAGPPMPVALPNGVETARPPSPPREPPPPMLTGLPTLDGTLSREPNAPGLPAKGALEVIGPTAVGKSKLIVQMVARCRVEAVLSQRRRQRGQAQQQQQGQEGTSDEAQEAQSGGKDDGVDYDRVLIIDTEGSLMVETIEAAIEAHVQEEARGEGTDELVDACLDGIYLIKAPLLPELMALLYLLSTPPAPLASSNANGSSGAASHNGQPLPPLHTLCAVFIDSISSPLRIPPGGANQRSVPRHLLAAVSSVATRLAEINPRIRLVATNQMALKMFGREGELCNSRTPGSIARMLPQVDAVGASFAGWNGVPEEGAVKHEASGAGLMVKEEAREANGAAAGRGAGVLGEAAQRVLMFRDGSSRYVQLIHPRTMDWIPFDIEGSLLREG